MRRLWPCLALLFWVSCGDDPEPEAPPANAAPARSSEASPTPERADEGARGAERVHYDLLRHLARAQVHHRDTHLIQLGEPQGHQHTLGGWRTRAGDTHDFDGTRAAVITGVTGYFLLPIASADRCHVSLRARAFGDGRVALYVDDETIGNVTLPTDGTWGVAEADIPPALCTPGEHDLRLRVARTGSAPGLARAGVAVDWIRLGPDADDGTHPAVEGDTLRLPDGWTISWDLEPRDGARLAAEIEGEVTIRAEADGAAPRTLSGPGASLGELAGQIVRLSFTARGDASITRPRVDTFDGAPLAAAPRVRNVVFYLTDTLRADHLQVYAPETRVETPGLSGWARQAATFLAGHSQENWTKPSCATLLSGLFPWEHQATGEDSQVPGSVELLSERLRGEGFHTGAFVANGFVSDRFGFRQGWDTFRNYVREGRRNMARFVAEDVIAWLDARPEDRPFFLYVHTIDPHVPYIPPSEDLARYDPDPYDGVVDFHRDRALLEGIKGGRIPLNARDRVRLEALYDGEITYHDRHFASVIEALERRGLADETLVVFTSDHGEELFDHGSVGHGHSVWEELIRVPLIVRWPGLTDEATRIEEAAGLVDVVPTALDALGMEPSEAVSGRSLAPILRGGTEDAPRPVVTGFMNGWRTIVVGRFKLIQRTASHISLYDLEADPGEQHDLAPERPIAVRYLRGLLGLTLAGQERRHEASRTDIDATLREQLEALGYAGASRAPTAAEAQADDEAEGD
ncbi:MAG: sulfatase-like hydrolase/transferase [Sandaracinaceae bacterium]